MRTNIFVSSILAVTVVSLTVGTTSAQDTGSQCLAIANDVADLGGLPAYDTASLLSNDDFFQQTPDHVIIYPPEDKPPSFVPDGPPRPTDASTGRLPIAAIHTELKRIYSDCTTLSNAAFDGHTPDPGDTTHDHLSCSTGCELKERRNWRCGGYRMGVNGHYEQILKAKCNSAIMNFEERCVLHKHERVDEEGLLIDHVPTTDNGYFRCENEKEWFVQLPNYFFYNLVILDVPILPKISRNLYQTAEIRVYCDREGGWENTLQPMLGVNQGKIKVVQLAPFNRYGGPGTAEQLLPTAEGRVVASLREQYITKVAKMQHIIDVKGFSGSPCSSLGVDGDGSIPLAQRSIIWDVPSPSVVQPVVTDN